MFQCMLMSHLGIEMYIASVENGRKMAKNRTPMYLTSPLLGSYPKEMKLVCQRDNLLMVMLFTVVKT